MSHMTIMYIMPILPLFPLITLIMKQKSFMMSLLCLEAIILSLVMFTACALGSQTMNEPYMCMTLLVFGACEASLGLAIMVSILRSFGNEMLNTITMSKC